MATNPDALIAQLLGNTGFGQTAQQIAAANIANQQGQQNLQAGAQAIDINRFKLEQAKQQAEQAQAQQAAYNADIAAWTAAGSPPSGLATLSAKYPDQWQAFQLSFKSGNEAQKKSDMQFYGGVHSLLSQKTPDLKTVRTLLSQRRAALEKAGQDTRVLDDYIQGIDAGDQTAIAGLKALSLASQAATDPDQYAQIYKATDDKIDAKVVGRSLVDPSTGNVIYRDPTPEYRTIKNPDGSESIVELNSASATAKGGDPASGAGVIGGMLAVTPFAESGNRERNADGTRVTSPKGARGVMQVMPKTANDPGYGITPSNGTPADDARLGRQYLTKMLDIYGDPAKAWAAYNAGPGAVDAAIAKARGGSGWLQNMPAETRQYVARNMAALNRQRAQGSNQAQAQTGGGARVVFKTPPAEKSPVDQATVDFYAQKIAAGGDLPAFGAGREAAAWRQAILKRAAEIQNGQGVSGADSNLRRADARSAAMALTQLQKTRSNIEGFERTFMLNVEQVLKTAPKGVAGGIPLFNAWVQAGRKATGDPEIARFNVAINTAANEYAKLASGASGGAVTSDSARHEAMQILNNAQTLPQLQAAIRQMQIDGHNRVVALQEQENRLRSTIVGRPVGPGSQAPAQQSGRPQFRIVARRPAR